MIKKISFENLRGFQDLKLPELTQITLLTGKNSAGKSTVLEGIFLLMGASSPETFEKIRSLRGLPVATEITKLWEPVFYNFDTTKPINISAVFDDHDLNLSYTRDDSFSTIDLKQDIQSTYITFTSQLNSSYSLKYSFSVDDHKKTGHLFMNANGALAMASESEIKDQKQTISLGNNTLFIRSAAAPAIDDAGLASWFGDLELTGEQQLVVDALRIIDPTIMEIKTIVQNRYVQLYIKTENATMPIKLTGDGMCKLIYIVLSILQNPNSIILIDEIENGFHYSMQESFWKTLAYAAKKSNSQIIATTHSYECINHAVHGIDQADMLNDFSLYRVDRFGEKTKAVHYSGDLLKDAVLADMEVR